MATKPFSFNLDLEEGKARLQDLYEKQQLANKSKAQREKENEEQPVSNFGFGKFGSSNMIRNASDVASSIPWDGKKTAESWAENNNIDFSKGPNGEDLSGPSSPMVAPEGVDWAGGGIMALQKAPSIIAMLQDRPTSQGEANMRPLQSAAQFAQIGGAFAPGIGHGIGAIVGAFAGGFSNQGWWEKQLDEKNKELLASLSKERKKLMQDYLDNNTLDNIKAETRLLAKTMGYSDRDYNT